MIKTQHKTITITTMTITTMNISTTTRQYTLRLFLHEMNKIPLCQLSAMRNPLLQVKCH
jgi:hypothetical protein